MNNSYIGDVGTEILVDVGVDADLIVRSKLIVKKPNGTVEEWETTPVSQTTKIKYVIQEGDFDVDGEYLIQAYVETSNWKGYGNKTSLIVKKRVNQ